MTGDRLEQYLELVFPRTESQTKKGVKPERWAALTQLFEESSSDLQLEGVRGTLWGAYNAVTHFEDYKQPKAEELSDQRLQRIWFGSGADLKQLALEKAIDLSVSLS